MGLFGKIRLDIRKERAEITVEECAAAEGKRLAEPKLDPS